MLYVIKNQKNNIKKNMVNIVKEHVLIQQRY
jgi:hypothetical protein